VRQPHHVNTKTLRTLKGVPGFDNLRKVELSNMQFARFTQNNEGFVCVKCGRSVQPHPSSSRDHCNHCLTGLHVDINPGDRLNTCGGVLEPIGIQTKSGKTKIVYRCKTCHEQVFNIVAPDDNAELIAELSGMSW